EGFPGDAVLGEEHGLDGTGGRTWVLDPIDGTKNFAAGIQIWGTLIALAEDGLPVLGVISAPALGERYQAARGLGATLNGEPIRVSSVDRVDGAFITCSSLDDWENGPLRGAFASLVKEADRTRGFGDFWGHTGRGGRGPGHPPLLAVEVGGGGEPRPGVAPRVREQAQVLDIQRHRLGDPPHGQVAVDPQCGIAGHLGLRAAELDLREVLHI